MDGGFDVVIWLHHRIMLYACIAWLLPLLGVVVFSWLITDLRPFMGGRADEALLYIIIGLPLWLGLCLYAEFSTGAPARRIKQWLENAPAKVGYIFLGGAGVLWLFGVI